MKKHTIGMFAAREDAEKAINLIHNDLDISTDDISYLYRNTDDEIKEVDAEDVSSDTLAEGAEKGAKAGAWIGAIAGVAVAAGVIPGLGAILVAGPLLTSLGVTGVIGSAAAGAISGAAVGGLVGALVNLGVGEENAQKYYDRVVAGDILVAVQSKQDIDVEEAMKKYGATDVESYTVLV